MGLTTTSAKSSTSPYIGEVGRELSDEDLQRAVQITQRTEWLALGLSLLVRLLLILLIIWYL